MKSVSPPLPTRDDLDWPAQAGVTRDVIALIREKAKAHDARRRSRRRQLGTGAVGLAVLVLAVFWGVPLVRDTSSITTLAAARQTLDLQDGSHADLNARTSLSTDFRYGRRVVHLDRGEAFFSVAKDPAHPFLVETPTGTVRVTGTKFNVRLNEAGTAEVTLLEGSVHVEQPNAAEQSLAPGQQLSTAGRAIRNLTAPDLEAVTAWRDGRLILDGLTLAGAIERLSAFHGTPIAVAPDAAELRANGSIAIDNLPGALDALQVLLPINVLPVDRGSYRIIRR